MKTIRTKMGARRLQRELKETFPTQREIIFLCVDWEDPYNVGGLFRVADACGIVQVILAGKTPAPPDPQISVTSLGNHRRVNFVKVERYLEAIAQIKEQGYQCVAIEIAEDSVPYFEAVYEDKVCFVLGNEKVGLYDSVLQQCDLAVVVPMAGKGRSLNVHVAGAIVAFECRFRGLETSQAPPSE